MCKAGCAAQRSCNHMKTKFMLCIAHYGMANRQHIIKCLNEYDKFEKYDIDCHLDLTDPIDLPEFKRIKIYTHFYKKDIGMSLTMEHRKKMASKLNDYDIFLYAEDDIFITEKNIDSWIDIQNTLPKGFVCGFLRYEQKEGDSYKFLFDTHPTHSSHRYGRETNTIFKEGFIINGEKYLELYNIHQGCYILTREMLTTVIDSGKYLEDENHYVGILEGAASNVFYKCGLIRILPAKKIENLLVHHSCNKYVKKLEYFYTKESTLDDKKWETLLN